jgi:DNA-binding response OmpR family regulator
MISMRGIRRGEGETGAIKLLVVDHDPAFRRLSALALHAPEIDLVTVATAREGLKALQAAELRDGAFDLLLLDMDLPGERSGALLSQLRALGLRVPVVLVSDSCDVKRKVRGLDLGADDFVVKPCSFDELLSRLRAVLRRTAAFFDPAGVATSPSVSA